MGRNSNPTAITPEIKAVIDIWDKFAKDNNLVLSTIPGLTIIKAGFIVKNSGACPCTPSSRLKCPCKECLAEVKEKGRCLCWVFEAPDFTQDPKKYGRIA